MPTFSLHTNCGCDATTCGGSTVGTLPSGSVGASASFTGDGSVGAFALNVNCHFSSFCTSLTCGFSACGSSFCPFCGSVGNLMAPPAARIAGAHDGILFALNVHF